MGRMEKVYQFLRPLSIIFCLLSFLWLLRALFLDGYPDFKTQYYVPQIVFNGGDPYKGGSSLFTPQVYPPSEFLFFVPFSLLPMESSAFIYTLLSVIAFYLSLFFLAKTFDIPFFSTKNLVFMGLAAIMFPVKFTLGMGQINMFILLLISLFCFSLKTKKYFQSGIYLGLSMMLKMFPPLLLGYFFLKPNKKLFIGFGVLVFFVSLFTVIFIPYSVIESFLQITPSLFNSWKLDYYNQALSGFIGRSFGTNDFAPNIKNFISILFLGITMVVIMNRHKNNFETIALVLGILLNINLLLNTFSWQHHFVWIIISFYATYNYIIKKKFGSSYLLLLFLSFILVATNLKDPSLIPIIFQSHVFYGGIILLLLQFKLILTRSQTGS